MSVQTPKILLPLVWPLPRSLATTSGISVDFSSSPYLDVSVQAVPHVHLCIQCTLTEYCSAGFPHSEISGSKPMCGSPKLIAACHVLLRLLMPRHSPCALLRLTSSQLASLLICFRKFRLFRRLLLFPKSLQLFGSPIASLRSASQYGRLANSNDLSFS